VDFDRYCMTAIIDYKFICAVVRRFLLLVDGVY